MSEERPARVVGRSKTFADGPASGVKLEARETGNGRKFSGLAAEGGPAGQERKPPIARWWINYRQNVAHPVSDRTGQLPTRTRDSIGRAAPERQGPRTPRLPPVSRVRTNSTHLARRESSQASRTLAWWRHPTNVASTVHMYGNDIPLPPRTGKARSFRGRRGRMQQRRAEHFVITNVQLQASQTEKRVSKWPRRIVRGRLKAARSVAEEFRPLYDDTRITAIKIRAKAAQPTQKRWLGGSKNRMALHLTK